MQQCDTVARRLVPEVVDGPGEGVDGAESLTMVAREHAEGDREVLGLLTRTQVRRGRRLLSLNGHPSIVDRRQVPVLLRNSTIGTRLFVTGVQRGEVAV
jgi:hypothetical protein